LLVSDDGVNGAVFRLDADAFRSVIVRGSSLDVGAGMDIQKLVLRTVRVGLAGIECLAGIPGTVGGAIRMNAGGKFGDIGTAISAVTVMDTEGQLYERTRDDLLFDYRRTNITAKFIIGATLDLEEQDPHQILNRTKEIWMYKRNTQPLNNKSAGCIFKNANGTSAGLLIDQAGLKGMKVGGAQISTKHANFIIAHPGCLADDVLRLIKLVREKVQAHHGIDLESEVQIWT
jgi:UDP-N-acetylmuramate dehydrogenase